MADLYHVGSDPARPRLPRLRPPTVDGGAAWTPFERSPGAGGHFTTPNSYARLVTGIPGQPRRIRPRPLDLSQDVPLPRTFSHVGRTGRLFTPPHHGRWLVFRSTRYRTVGGLFTPHVGGCVPPPPAHMLRMDRRDVYHYAPPYRYPVTTTLSAARDSTRTLLMDVG